MIDMKTAFDTLSQFQTPEDIATFLLGQDVQGNKDQADSCALAIWMQDVTGMHVLVSIDCMWVDNISGNQSDNFSLTSPMSDFVCNFDNGLYPKLELGQDPVEYDDDEPEYNWG